MKYLVFSFDDGTVHDRKMIELLNKYNLKASFNLNSELPNFSWSNNGVDIVRFDLKEVTHLYKGHEICSHSCTHPRLNYESEERVRREIFLDKKNLEKIFHRQVKGFAIPFSGWNEHIIDLVKEAGYSFCRLPARTSSFKHEEDNFHLASNALTFDDDLLQIINNFSSLPEEDNLCIVSGHSYEFYCNNTWDYLERVFKYIASLPNVKCVTMSQALVKLKRV